MIILPCRAPFISGDPGLSTSSSPLVLTESISGSSILFPKIQNAVGEILRKEGF